MSYRWRARRGPVFVSTYFDTNAVSTLFRHRTTTEVLRAQELRRSLKAAVRARRVLLIGSAILMQELAGLAEPDSAQYRRVVRYLHRLIRHRVLLGMGDLWRYEYERIGRMPEARRYLHRRTLASFWMEVARPRFAREVFEETKAAAQKFARDEEQRRGRIRERFRAIDGENPDAAVKRWWKEGGVDQIDSWTRSSLAAQLERRGASPRLADGYPVRMLPSLWNLHAYKMARIALNVGENRRIKPSDDADANHYVCGSYADIFVSDDADLLATVAAMPNPAVRLMKLDAFAARFLGP